jgi:hypothetical protein
MNQALYAHMNNKRKMKKKKNHRKSILSLKSMFHKEKSVENITIQDLS